MPSGNQIIICQSGGKLTTTDDGSLSYSGGDAHAIGVDSKTRFDELKSEVAEMWRYDPNSLTMKYFLPNNNKKLITISSDKDIKRMLSFYRDSTTIDVFVFTGEEIVNNVSTLLDTRFSQIAVVEPNIPFDLMLPLDPEPLMVEDTQISTLEDVEEAGQFKLLKVWENCITGVEQKFNSVEEFRDALRKYIVARGFRCTFTNNDCIRVTAKCKAEGCPWRIRASRLSTTRVFVIRKFNATHTCGVGNSVTNRPKATKKLVVSIMKEMLRESPTSRPREIADEIQQGFGIELNYSDAWRGMETARNELQDSFSDSYNQLPWLCEKIRETNPGSVVTLVTREDMSFHRLFVSFYASLSGFQNGCRPLLFLDAKTLNSKYKSEILTATALDGNDGIFPVAFAIIDKLNIDNWEWFLEQLNAALSISQPITFVADKKMGLRRSLSKIFENSFHAYCLHHLTEDLKKHSNRTHLQEVVRKILVHFFDAAYTAIPDTYAKCVESIRNISPGAYQWILQSEPKYWANALFEGSRYNHLTTNIGDSFYNWVTEVPLLPIADIVDNMRRKMMELIYTRRFDSGSWSTKLTPRIEDKLQEEIVKAQSLQVIDSVGGKFEVSDDLGAVSDVNIDKWSCSCRMWQIIGVPCLHAVAAVRHNNGNIYDYCSKYFKTETFRLLYLGSINPLPTADRPVHKDSSPTLVRPPIIHLLAGQAKKRRIRSRGVVKRPLRCSRCKGIGHNRATCHIPSM